MKATRLRISIRVAAAVMSLISVALAFWANAAHRQRAAVEVLREAGILVAYEYQHDETGRFVPDAKPPLPEPLRSALGDDFFFNVVSADNPGHRGAFGDKEAKVLTDLPKVRFLNVGSTCLTDSGLSSIGRLRHVEYLSLSLNPSITDAGVAHLRNLPQLKQLDLRRTGITDACVPSLTNLSTLENLDLTGTDITNRGANKLRLALPNCRIDCYPRLRHQPIRADAVPRPSESLRDLFTAAPNRGDNEAGPRPPGPVSNPFGAATPDHAGNEAYSPPGHYKLNLPSRPGFHSWRPDRKLSPEELRRIAAAGEFLRKARNDWSDRCVAARELGEWGHATAFDPLLEVMQDEAENEQVRRASLIALSMIADERVIPPLIEMVTHPDLGLNAREQLSLITGEGEDWGYGTDAVDDPKRAAEILRDRWRVWWQKNRGRIELDRTGRNAGYR